MKAIFKTALLASSIFVANLAVASSESEQKASIALCSMSQSSHVVNGCKDGDQVAFIPSAAATEKPSLAFAARFCDLDETIILRRLGVVCTYQKKTLPETEE